MTDDRSGFVFKRYVPFSSLVYKTGTVDSYFLRTWAVGRFVNTFKDKNYQLLA